MMKIKNIYPKVLIINQHAFSYISGSGITLSNLFYGWPKDRIAKIYDEVTTPNNAVCGLHYKLGENEKKWNPPFNMMNRAIKKKGAVKTNDNKDIILEKNLINLRGRNLMREFLYRPIINFLMKNLLVRKYVLSKNLEKWISSFNPDLIYCWGGADLGLINLILQISKLTNAKLVVHIMDDWSMTIYKKQLFSPVLRAITLRRFKKLLKLAHIRMSIGEEMSLEYRKRYGYEFLPFQNVVDISFWGKCLKEKRNDSPKNIIVYSGRVVKNEIFQSLIDISKAIEGLNEDGVKTKFMIYLTKSDLIKYKEYFTEFKYTILHTPVENNKIVDLFLNAKILVLPFDFNKENELFLRLSKSTKVPAYLISGTPILYYGPRNIAVAKYLSKNNCAILVTGRNINLLKKKIVFMIENQNIRTKMKETAQKIAIKNHNAARIRKNFQETLIQLYNGGNPNHETSTKRET